MTLTAVPKDAYEAAAAEELRKEDAAAQGPTFDQMSPLGLRMMAEFNQAEKDRQEHETRWLKALRNYKGRYDSDTMKKIGKRSKAFVKKTRTKVKTVDARMMEILFPSGKDKNWDLDVTPKPSVSPEFKQKVLVGLVQELTTAQQQIAQQNGQDPNQIPQVQPTRSQLEEAVRKATKDACKRMGQTIEDQLAESKYRASAKEVIHSGNLFGTGILKGPLADRKTRTRYVERNGKWGAVEEQYTVPFTGWVPLWNWYPDMSATKIEDCRHITERHRMTRAAMTKLANLPKFNRAKVIEYIKARPDGEVNQKHFDTELRTLGDRSSLNISKTGLYEIFERWGWLTADDLDEAGVKVPPNRKDEMFFGVVWFLPNCEVVKAAIQPVNGASYPYHAYYYDKDETTIFAEGVALVMEDDQDMINAGTRMMLDNAAACAGPQFEIDTTIISPREKYNEVYPFKAWKRDGGEPGRRGINVIEIPSHIEEIAAIVDRFDINADETTSIPRYMNGENVTQGAAGTLGGLSMLMGAVNVVIKDLVVNYDEGITNSYIAGIYRWNMRFNPDPSIKGDFDVIPKGASSLVAKEVRAQALGQYAQTIQPEERPFVNWEKLARMRAEAMELPGIIKSEDEVINEANDPNVQKMNAMNQRMQEAQVAQLEAKAMMDNATAMLRQVDAMAKRVTAAYEAMQAGGVAVQNPRIAPAGDEILRSAGWQDATPQQPIAGIAPEQAMQVGAMPPSAGAGKQAGIETPGIAQ